MSELKDVSGGEWAAEYTFRIGDALYVTDVFSAKGYDVACVYGRTEEEATANAKLMAAAKDMAGALKGGIRVFDVLEGQLADERAAVEKFRAALKKAGIV